MKKIITVFAASAMAFSALAQCNPSQLFTAIGIPGVYPLPTDPLPDGLVNEPYNVTGLTLTFVTSDQAVDPSSLPLPLPFPIPPGNQITVTGITAGPVTGLPPGMTSACNNANCSWTFPEQGCILLSGTPTATGEFTVSFDLTLSGTLDSPFGSFPIPGQALPVQYTLTITDGSSVPEFALNGMNLYPNPATESVMIAYPAVEKETARVEMIDLNGRVVASEERNVSADGGILTIETASVAQGLYRVVFTCGNVRTASKLMISK
jgi:hypothetical protein